MGEDLAWDPGTLWLLEEYAHDRTILMFVHRTLHGSMSSVTGTGGHIRGVDFHIEIHCDMCCCRPHQDWSCGRAPITVVARGTSLPRVDWRPTGEKLAEDHRLLTHHQDKLAFRAARGD
jgi:hypothetical protein